MWGSDLIMIVKNPNLPENELLMPSWLSYLRRIYTQHTSVTVQINVHINIMVLLSAKHHRKRERKKIKKRQKPCFSPTDFTVVQQLPYSSTTEDP